MTTTILLSWPPSTNDLWRAVRGRNILSRKARLWLELAGKELLEQKIKPILGEIEMEIELCSPFNRPFDLDNRVKAVLDLLVKSGIIEDDSNRFLKRLVVSVGSGFKGATVVIRQI